MMEQNGKVQGVETEVWALDANAKERAQAFLAQKERANHYMVEGSDADGGDGYRCGEFCYTDEEVARIKQLMSEAYVRYMNVPAGEYSMEQILKEVNLCELKGIVDELDGLLFTPCEDEYFMNPEKIDLDHPVHYYRMTCHVFNEAKRKVEAMPFRMILTDEEYVHLLALQLMYRKELSFNRLFCMHQKLALKINNWANGVFWAHSSFMHCPYVVIMDEIREDAFLVDGPEPMKQHLYEHDDFEFSFYIAAFMERRTVRVEKEIMNNRVSELSVYALKEISADELMTRLGASDYTDMMKKLKKRFSGKGGFEKFKAYLDTEKIAYVMNSSPDKESA